MSDTATGQIDNVMQENRLFPPSDSFSASARIQSMEQYEELYDQAKADPDKFWGEIARDELHWFEPFNEVMSRDGDVCSWFVGGKTNISYNCLDANIAAGKGDTVAIVWEGEPGDQRTLTYSELHLEVCKFANALKNLGCEKGDVGFHLHAYDARTCRCNACLRPYWCDPLSHLRRFFCRSDC